MIKLSIPRGNTKLPSSTAIFSLPSRVTCGGMTDECKEYCYAKEAEKMYPAVLPARNRNLTAVKDGTFERRIIDYLESAKGIKAFRIHESGDFIDQKYLEAWFRIAGKFPKIIFYAYTKMFSLSFDKRPKNFIIFASTPEPMPGFDGQAIVIPKRGKAPKGFLKCCGSCKKCDFCFTPGVKYKRIALGTGKAFDERQRKFFRKER